MKSGDGRSFCVAEFNPDAARDVKAMLRRWVKYLEADLPRGKPKGKRGRPRDTDQEEDRRILNAWDTGRHPTYAALARELHLTERDVKLAIDRQKKRQRKGAHE
jgi:hypothetical protein